MAALVPYARNSRTHSDAQIARVCYAIELNPIYVDVAIRRWQDFTGQRAYLEATGEPFPE